MQEIIEFNNSKIHRNKDGDYEYTYRTLSNIGQNGGQEVPHFHFHIFAGEKIGKIVI